MTSPAPGWYPDPGGTAPFRWWDGQAWTTATSDGVAPAAETQTVAQPAAPAYAADTAVQQQYDAGSQPAYSANPQFGAVDPSVGIGGGSNTAYGTKSAFDASGNSNYTQIKAQQDARSDTFFHKNQAAMWTFIVTAIYIFIAIATGFGIIGIVPAFLAYQSFSRGEQLAPLAIGAAVIGIVVGIATFQH